MIKVTHHELPDPHELALYVPPFQVDHVDDKIIELQDTTLRYSQEVGVPVALEQPQSKIVI